MISKAVRSLARPAALVAFVAPLVVSDAPAMEIVEYGPRLGFSVDPDQVTFGAYGDWGELSQNVHLRTNGDLGLGDNIVSITLNGDVTYHFPGSEPFVPYVGGGLGYAFYDFDVSPLPGIPVDDTFHEIGVNLVAGIVKEFSGYKNGGIEVRFGIDDIPDIKLTASLGFF